MDFTSELAGVTGESGRDDIDMPILNFGNAATPTPTENRVMFVSQTHTATTTTSIVYANANDAQSSAFYSDLQYGAAEVNVIASPSNAFNISDHNFDWDVHLGNFVIQEYVDIDPTMQTMVMDIKQESSPPPSSLPNSQHTGIMEAAPSNLALEQLPMTWNGSNHEMGLRPFDYVPPKTVTCSPHHHLMAETVPTVFVTEANNYSTSFGSSGWNGIFTDSLSSPLDACQQEPTMQTSSEQSGYLPFNLPFLEPEDINAARNHRPMTNILSEFVANVQSTNMPENPPQGEMNEADNFLEREYSQVLEAMKLETEDEPQEENPHPPQTHGEIIGADNGNDSYMVQAFGQVLRSIKVEMEGATNITVEHQLNDRNMRDDPPQREMNQVYNFNSFPESENQALESVEVELGDNSNITVEHQLHQLNGPSPMNMDFSCGPPMHQSQSQQTPLESQEIYGGNYTTFNIGDYNTENLFIAPTPYSSQIAVNSPNGSYSDSGFSSSQFSSQEVFSSQENEPVFTTKELSEAFDEVDGSPSMKQPVASQNMIETTYMPPMSVPVPSTLDSTYYDFHDENDNAYTSDEDEDRNEEEVQIKMPRKRGSRSRRSSKRCRVARAAAVTTTSNSECGSSDGDYQPRRPITQRPSTGVQRAPRVRMKDDVTSFRHLMGPHLRTLSAVLEMSGLKMVHDLVPYEVIRRFHPTDIYRTITRSISLLENVDSPSKTNESQPDWESFVAKSNGSEITTLDSSNDRIYYKSPFGRLEEEGEKEADCVIIAPMEPCTLSIKNEAEINGKLAQSPEVKTGVGSAELNVKLNLHKVAERCTNVEFKQSELYDRPLIMRLKNPQSIAMVYDTGKLIVIGLKSYDEFRIAVRKFARMVQKTGVNVHLTQLTMHFYIGLFILPFDVNVNAMRSHEYLSKYFMFDTDVFPGVIIKLPNNPMLALVFETGAVVFTNAVQASDMKETLDKIYPTLRLFGHQH